MRATGRGFSMVELLAVLAIVAILATLALPALGVVVVNQRVRGAAFDLAATLTLARSEAIKRGASVTVQADGPGWESGWRILDGNGKLLRQHPPVSGNIRINGPGNVVYARDGRLPQAGATAAFDIAVDPARATTERRCVQVELTGRTNSRKGACA